MAKKNNCIYLEKRLYLFRKTPINICPAHQFTLGPAYNDFGYNEHPAITSNFFSQKNLLLMTSMLKKSTHNEYHL